MFFQLSLLLPVCCGFGLVGAASYIGYKCAAAPGSSMQNRPQEGIAIRSTLRRRLDSRLAELTLLLDVIGFTALGVLAYIVTDTFTAAFVELEVGIPVLTRAVLRSPNHIWVFCAAICVALVLKDSVLQCRAASLCTNIILAVVGVCISIMFLILVAIPYVSGTVRLAP